jgi:beta-lactamase regulating signal transducer with metallopeptidase domain
MNANTVLPILLELLAKSVALLLGAALLVQAMRRASAAQRHFIWAAAFVTLLALPLTKLIVPRWSVTFANVAPPVMEDPAGKQPVPAPLVAAPLEASANQLAGIDGIAAASVARPSPDWAIHWRDVATLGWLTGVALIIGYRLLGSIQLSRLKRGSVALADSSLESIAKELAAQMAVSADLRISEHCDVPCTWGLRRSVILFPSHSSTWPSERVSAALRHELAHIQRRDYFVRWLAQIVCALYWPNPLVWLAARSLRMAQEQACDDSVVCAGARPEDYASQLVETTRSLTLSSPRPMHAVMMARQTTLEGRVLAIVDKSRNRRPASGRTRSSAAVGIVAALAASAFAQLGEDNIPGARNSTTPAQGAPIGNETFVTRDYRVHKRFLVPVEGGYVRWSPGKGSNVKVYTNVEEVLNGGYPDSIRYQRVKFPPGARISYDPELRILRVHSTRANLALVESLLVYEGAIPLSALVRIDPTVLITRLFRVVPDFVVSIGGDRVRARNGGVYRNAQEFLMANRLVFQPGASAIYYPAEGRDNPILEVTNTPANLIAIQEFLEHEHSFRAAGMAERSALIAWNQEVTVERPSDGLFVEEHIVSGDIIYRVKDGSVVGPGGRKYADVKALLIANGIGFPRGASATLLYGIDYPYILQVCNTPKNLDAIEHFGSRTYEGSLRDRPGHPTTGAIAPKLIIPKVEFREATIRECVAFLQRKSIELDPKKKGVNLTLKVDEKEAARKVTLGLSNVPLSEAVNYVANLAGLVFHADRDGWVIQSAAALQTREFRVPAGFLVPVEGGVRGSVWIDNDKAANAQELFKKAGIHFPAGASANFIPEQQKLVVRNTQENLDLIDTLILAAGANPR